MRGTRPRIPVLLGTSPTNGSNTSQYVRDIFRSTLLFVGVRYHLRDHLYQVSFSSAREISSYLLFSIIRAIKVRVFRNPFLFCRKGKSLSMVRCACLASSEVAARPKGCHLVLPESSFISSTSATSISGLWGGEEPTEMTFGDEASILSPMPWFPAAVSLPPPPPPRNVDVALKGIGTEDCGACAGSRTFMVTLLGVRVIGGTGPASPGGSNAAGSFGGVEGALPVAESVEASCNLSTDMLL